MEALTVTERYGQDIIALLDGDADSSHEEAAVREENDPTKPQYSALSKAEITQLRSLVKGNLYLGAKGVFGFDLMDQQVHAPLCESLMNYKENTRIKIVLPRGWFKTTLCSQAYPIWRSIVDPNVRILLVQNTFSNSVSKLRTIGAVYKENSLFRLLFPELLPTKGCVWKGESMCINRPKAYNESTFEAAGANTQVVSRHYNVIIEDDTVAPDLDQLTSEVVMPSQEDIQKAIGWHRLMVPLFDHPKDDQNLVVGTRWYQEDLLSWIDANEGDSYVCYNRAVKENDEGKPDQKGRLTFPSRFDEETLEEIEKKMGPYMFRCLYYNEPVMPDQMTFKPEWITYYEEEDPTEDCVVYTTVDPAGDPALVKGDPDFNVVLTTAKNLYTGEIKVLDYFHEKCSPNELIDAIFTHVRLYNPVKVGVETVAYQNSLLYWVNDRMRVANRYFSVESLKHSRKSKNQKIMGLQPLFRNKIISVREWMNELVYELMNFPLGANDDLIDALAMQIEMWDATRTVEQMRPNELDPRSLQQVIIDIKGRHGPARGTVMDVLSTSQDRRLA
jgi:predicted phage terminase large subunit-like protein